MSEEPVAVVTDVYVGYLKSNPPIPFVSADGLVPTSGWSSANLQPRVYTDLPADGIQDFDFVATPPGGISLPVELPIQAPAFLMESPPSWLRGVRVHARRNALERLLASSGPALATAELEAPDESKTPAALAEADGLELAYDHVDDEVALELAADETCHRFKLLSIGNWPEVKTEFENKCIRIFGKKVCTKVPVLYRRTCDLSIEAEVCWPSGKSIAAEVEDCARQALAAGILSGLLTGNLGVAAGVLQQYLRTCLVAKGVKFGSDVRVGLRQHKSCGPWKPV